MFLSRWTDAEHVAVFPECLSWVSGLGFPDGGGGGGFSSGYPMSLPDSLNYHIRAGGWAVLRVV